MAKSFLVPINLNQLELQNATIQNLASAPASPVKGQIYFNTTTNKAMVYDGTNWVPWEADTNAVTGVKGNSESSYRTGNVNITAANVGAAPTSHASTATTYGQGTNANYGHVKLSDSTSSTTAAASGGTAATPKAVKDALDAAKAYADALDTGVSDVKVDGASVVTSGVANVDLTGKVDKVSGKGLSTNDYTTTEKNKLAGIASGAEVNVQSDWNQATTTADDYIKNKPTLGTAAAKNYDTTVTSGSSNLITSGAVSSAIGAADAMRFKGTLGTGGTVTSLPTSGVKVGDTYRVITAGTYSSIKCEVGDLIIAVATTPSWTVAQANIDGAVTASTTTTNGYLAKFTGDKIVANGPQLGSSTTTYLNNAGNWATPPDTKVTAVGNHYTPSGGTTTSASGATGSAGTTVQVVTGITKDAAGHVTGITSGAATDTRNTAGATDSSSKLFLIGATSQTANPQTYSQNTAYVGTDGFLYSDSSKVLSEKSISIDWIAPGETSVTAEQDIRGLLAYKAWIQHGDGIVTSLEEVVVDCVGTPKTGGYSNYTFSIAAPISENIVVQYTYTY